MMDAVSWKHYVNDIVFPQQADWSYITSSQESNVPERQSLFFMHSLLIGIVMLYNILASNYHQNVCQLTILLQ